jgi:hypothetical protein
MEVNIDEDLLDQSDFGPFLYVGPDAKKDDLLLMQKKTKQQHTGKDEPV